MGWHRSWFLVRIVGNLLARVWGERSRRRMWVCRFRYTLVVDHMRYICLDISGTRRLRILVWVWVWVLVLLLRHECETCRILFEETGIAECRWYLMRHIWIRFFLMLVLWCRLWCHSGCYCYRIWRCRRSWIFCRLLFLFGRMYMAKNSLWKITMIRVSQSGSLTTTHTAQIQANSWASGMKQLAPLRSWRRRSNPLRNMRRYRSVRLIEIQR